MPTLYGNEALRVLEDNAPDFEDIDDDEQRRYNHENCIMGEDTKKRLYVTKAGGKYLWHCHNCNYSGFYAPRGLTSIRPAVTTKKTEKVYSLDDYNRATKELSSFDTDMKLWLWSYEFSVAIVDEYGIRADSSGVYLPVYSFDRTVVGYQIRRVNAKPKYLTYTNQNYSLLHISNDVLVITEDLLSAYKLNKCGFSTMSLLGTKLHSTAIEEITRQGYKRVLVWLDDDAAGHKGALEICRYLSAFVDTRSIFMQQPKEIPYYKLKTLVI